MNHLARSSFDCPSLLLLLRAAWIDWLRIEPKGFTKPTAKSEHYDSLFETVTISPQKGQERVSIPGQLLKAVLIMLGLGRFTEADLIWRYNAIAVFDEHIDRLFPGGGAKVFTWRGIATSDSVDSSQPM